MFGTDYVHVGINGNKMVDKEVKKGITKKKNTIIYIYPWVKIIWKDRAIEIK